MNAWLPLLNALAGGWSEALARASWQGGLALVAVWVVCRLAPRLPAGAQCWLWRIAYLKLLVALCWVTPIDLPILPAPPAPAPEKVRIAEAPRRVDRAPLLLVPVTPPAPSALRSAAPAPRPVFPTWELGLMLLWLLGVGCGASRLLGQRLRTAELRHGCVPSRDGAALQLLADLGSRFGLRRCPELLVGPVPGPLMVGALRPAIVLPVELEATTAEQEWILAHELAHVQRHDLAWAHLPVLTQLLFFFHPMVWLTQREWRLAQEMACDALTVQVTAARACDYGALLVRLASRPSGTSGAGLSFAGILETGSTLERRLNVLRTSPHRSRLRVWCAGSVLALALGGLIPWRVSAQAKATSPRPLVVVRPSATPAAPTVLPAPQAVLATPTATDPTALPAPAAVFADPAATPPLALPAPTAALPSATPPIALPARPLVQPAPAALPAPLVASPLRVVAPLPAVPAATPVRPTPPVAVAPPALVAVPEALPAVPAAPPVAATPPARVAVPEAPTAVTRARPFAVAPLARVAVPGAPLALPAFAPAPATRKPLPARKATPERLQPQSDVRRALPASPAVSGGPALADPGILQAAGIVVGPYAGLIATLTPTELLQYIATERQATRVLLEATRERYQNGNVAASELLPLETKAAQLDILVRAAERLAQTPVGPRRSNLYAALTPAELLLFLRAELTGARSLRDLTQAQVNAGIAPNTALLPLEARAQQLEILSRAAERRVAKPE